MAGSIQVASILAGETAPEEEQNILLPAFYDIFWGGICFLILLFVVWRYALPRIRQTLEERTAGIEGKLATAERDRAQAESLLAQYRDQLAEARSDAARIRAKRSPTARPSSRRPAPRRRRRLGSRESAPRLDSPPTSRRHGSSSPAMLGDSRSPWPAIVGDSLDENRTRSTVDRFLDELDAQVPAPGAGTGGRRCSGCRIARSRRQASRR